MTICTECGKDDDCRPYGENGAMICFDCGMKNESRTRANFIKQLEAAIAISPNVVLGEESGPRPILGTRQ